MPPDLPKEQELNLKKRARRRLVGAVALVLLMIIVLPQVLQDRSALTQHEAVKITMPNVVNDKNQETSQQNTALEVTPDVILDKSIIDKSEGELHANSQSSKSEPALENIVASKEAGSKKNERALIEAKSSQPKPEKKTVEKASEIKSIPKETPVKSAPAKAAEVKTTPKQETSFTIQVGVYSDAANVTRLQEQLKQAGFKATTEKVTTAKGESIRLKTGHFNSREEAVSALAKLKEIGLQGIVVGNE